MAISLSTERARRDPLAYKRERRAVASCCRRQRGLVPALRTQVSGEDLIYFLSSVHQSDRISPLLSRQHRASPAPLVHDHCAPRHPSRPGAGAARLPGQRKLV